MQIRNLILNVITSVIFAYLFGAVCVFLQKCAKKKDSHMSTADFVVRAPAPMFWLAFFCGVLFMGLMYLTIKYDANADRIVYVVFFVLVALDLFFIYYIVRWKIVVKDDTICCTPLFGRKKEYLVRDVKKVFEGRDGLDVFSGQTKLFSIPAMYIGFNLFVRRVKEEQIVFVGKGY